MKLLRVLGGIGLVVLDGQHVVHEEVIVREHSLHGIAQRDDELGLGLHFTDDLGRRDCIGTKRAARVLGGPTRSERHC